MKTNAEGRVIRLYVGLNNLTGAIPEEMFRLTDLEHLDLGANPGITGGLPSAIGALTKLKALYLYGTGLTGPLPGEVAKLADIPDSGGDFNKIVFRVEGTGLCVPPGLEGAIVPKISYISNDDGYILGVLCEERATLVDIYEALGGEDWKKKGNWLSNHPLHSWEGVKTNAEGRVIRLYVGLNNLTGAIPEEMFRLTDLEHLDLGANPGITGGLPSAIGALTKLKALYLYGTGLTGPLPSEVAKLADIPDSGGDFNKIVFRVEGTGLCVPPGLEGVIVPKISYISNDDGYILGVLCEERATLVDIYEALGGDDWKKKDNWLSNSPLHNWEGVKTNAEGRVIRLYLGHKNLTGAIPEEMFRLTSLEYLRLGSNPELTGALPSGIGALAKLKELDLYDTGLSGPLPGEVAKLVDIPDSGGNFNEIAFWIESTGLCVPPELEGDIVPKISYISNDDGYILGVLCEERATLVDIYEALGGDDWKKKDNWLSNSPLHNWEGVKTNAEGRVIRLYLGHKNLTGAIPEEMFRLTSLEYLRLGSNPELTGALPSGIGALAKLKELDLYDTGLSGPLPGEVAKLVDIPDSGGNFNEIAFWIESTGLCVPPELEGDIVPKISYTSNDAGYIRGVLCEERATLEAIYEALGGDDWKKKDNWLSNSPLHNWEGVKTNAEGRVIRLYLSGPLTGAIPAELARLTDLEYLWLSENPGLTGCVPGALRARLTSSPFPDDRFCAGGDGTPPARVGQPQPGTPTTPGTNPAPPGTNPAPPVTTQPPPATKPAPPQMSPEADRPALVAFYHATGGEEHWNVKWPVESDPGEAPISGWWGVTTGDDGLVTGLDLTGNKLNGRVPGAELGRLSGLRKVSLGGNDLTGSIPSALGDLAGLEWLGLSENKLTGSIPRNLARLAGLRHLFLSDNELTGIIPVELGGLSALHTFYISGNPMYRNAIGNVVGCIPEGLKDVQRGDLDQFRQELNIDYCTHDLAHSDRAALMALYNAAGGRNWKAKLNWGSDEPIGKWHGVTTDSNSRVTGLDLRGNNLSGSISPELGSLAKLEALALSDNSIRGGIPAELGNLAKLRSLAFQRNGLRGNIPAELGDLTGLRVLNLGGNDLNGPIPAGLGRLAKLESLRLDDNDLTGRVPQELGSLSSLRELDLAWNELTNPIPGTLGDLGDLRTLDLSGNDFTGVIPGGFGRLQKLEELHLVSNRLSGDIPVTLGNLRNLQFLTLSGNQLTGEIPEQLGRLANLEGLYLPVNDLTGEIPSSLGDLTKLVRLDLNHNNLSGDISWRLGGLTKLRILRIQANDPGFSKDACVPASLSWQLAHRGYANSDLGGVPFCAAPTPPPEKPVEADRAALVAFYYATGGPTHWKVKWPVDSDAPIRTWHGVVVDRNGRVIKLFLYDNGLTGNLPEKLDNLDKLQLLELGNNDLTIYTAQQLVTFLLNVQSASWNVTGNDFVGTAIIPKTSVNYLEVITDQLESISEVLKSNNPGGRGWRVAKGLSKASYLSDLALPLEVINIAMNTEVGAHEENIRFALDALGASGLAVTDVCFSCSEAANCLTDPTKQVWEC